MTEEMTETPAVTEPEGLDEFLAAYIEAALWSSTDNADDGGGEPLDRNFDEGDIAPETLVRMRADCAAFLAHRLGGLPGGVNCTVAEYAGHDFWLTRNGHGCGFWDGDWPEGVGEGLDRLAHEFGEWDLSVGDDGLIYGC